MNTYEIYYATENNFIDSVFVDAPNRIGAQEQFVELMKNFEDEVITADCFLVEED